MRHLFLAALLALLVTPAMAAPMSDAEVTLHEILVVMGSYRWMAADLLEHHMGAITAIIAVTAIIQWREYRKSSERQLRAYVEVEIEKISFSDTELSEVVLKIHNFGQTPAYEVVTNSWVDLRAFPPAPNASYSGPAGMGPQARAIINPQRAVRAKTGTARAFTHIELAEIKDGTSRRFYVFGNTCYRDTFGKRRQTDFCFAVKGAPNVVLDVAIVPAEANGAS